MEVSLEVESGVDQVVLESSLLNKLVFIMDSHVLDLFLRLLEVLVLLLFDNISPLVHQLLELVLGEHVVEDSELGSGKPSEVSDLNVSNVESKKELMVEDKSSDPFIMVPSSELSNSCDSSNVGSEEDNSSSGSGERLVMRRHLLRTSGFRDDVPGVEGGGEGKRVLLRVVRMNIARIESVIVLLVIASSILGLVDGLRNLGNSFVRIDLSPGGLKLVLDSGGGGETSRGSSNVVSLHGSGREGSQHLNNL